MIRVVLLAIIVLGATASAVYTLTQIDQIVHGQLYSYGLTFSLEWANPYWNLLRVTLILLDVVAVSTVISLALTLHKYRVMKKISDKKTRIRKPMVATSSALHSHKQKPESPYIMPPQQAVTSPTTPRPAATPPPSPSPLPPETSGLTKCSHCGKLFTQPLRMLDFQGDRPRIINICPFCNEIVPSSQASKEGSQAPENPAVRAN